MNSTAHSRALESYVSRQVRSFSIRELTLVSSAQAVRVAVANGALVRLMKGIYLATEHADSFVVRAHAALRWAGPSGVLTGESALFLWGVTPDPPQEIHVALFAATGRTAPHWIRVTRTEARFDTAEWMSFTIARAEPALVQTYGRLPRSSRETLVFDGVRRGVLLAPKLADVLQGTYRVRARKDLQRVVSAILVGDESHLERKGSATVFATNSLKQLLRQHRIRVDGTSYRLDYYDPETRTAIELDGAAYHGDLKARTRDITRDVTLAAQGILTMRFGYRDVMDRPDWCREKIVQTLRARRVQ